MQVKIISDSDPAYVERQVNQFIKDKENVSLQFSTVFHKLDDELVYSVFITYCENQSETEK